MAIRRSSREVANGTGAGPVIGAAMPIDAAYCSRRDRTCSGVSSTVAVVVIRRRPSGRRCAEWPILPAAHTILLDRQTPAEGFGTVPGILVGIRAHEPGRRGAEDGRAREPWF